MVKSICVLHHFIHHEDNMNCRCDNDNAIVEDHHRNMRSLSPARKTRPTAEAMSVCNTERILCFTSCCYRVAGQNDPLTHAFAAVKMAAPVDIILFLLFTKHFRYMNENETHIRL